EIYTVTYYDNYSFLGQSYFNGIESGFEYDGDIFDYERYPDVANSEVKGYITGSKTKVLGSDENDQYVKMATYYDDHYRIVQTTSDNHLGGKEKNSSYYDNLSNNVK